MSERLNQIRETNTRMMAQANHEHAQRLGHPGPAPLRQDINYLLQVIDLLEKQVESLILASLDPDVRSTPTTPLHIRAGAWLYRKVKQWKTSQ